MSSQPATGWCLHLWFDRYDSWVYVSSCIFGNAEYIDLDKYCVSHFCCEVGVMIVCEYVSVYPRAA